MSGQLAEVEARIETVRKLSAVITAMRGIAASRVQDAHRHLDAIGIYAATIGEAIGRALVFRAAPDATRAAGGGAVIIALCAEHGFAGAFSARVLEAATAAGPGELLLVGDRGLLTAQERGMKFDWTESMIAHPSRTAQLAGQIAETVFRRISEGRARAVSIVHAVPGGEEGYRIAVKRLVPFDYGRFPVPQTNLAPRITLAPDVLLARLVQEYVFAEISEAVMMSFAAENEARMRAMIAAHDNVTKSREELLGRSRQLRQTAITEEIVELASGSLPER